MRFVEGLVSVVIIVKYFLVIIWKFFFRVNEFVCWLYFNKRYLVLIILCSVSFIIWLGCLYFIVVFGMRICVKM